VVIEGVNVGGAAVTCHDAGIAPNAAPEVVTV
jgi:hypothetical protein